MLIFLYTILWSKINAQNSPKMASVSSFKFPLNVLNLFEEEISIHLSMNRLEKPLCWAPPLNERWIFLISLYLRKKEQVDDLCYDNVTCKLQYKWEGVRAKAVLLFLAFPWWQMLSTVGLKSEGRVWFPRQTEVLSSETSSLQVVGSQRLFHKSFLL